jgi:membrane protease YdiL (CAAX protease family)
MIPENFRKAAILGAVAFFVTAWLAINYSFNVGVIYSAIVIFSMIGYLEAGKLGIGKLLVGIPDHLQNQIVVGVALGAGFILLHFLAPGVTIGVPVLPAAASGDQFIVSSGVAPVVEELGFRGIGLALADSYLPWIFAALAVSVTFSLYHYVTYGAAMSGAFLGAFIFSMVACFVVKRYKSIVPVIIMHAIFNTYLLLQMTMVGGRI